MPRSCDQSPFSLKIYPEDKNGLWSNRSRRRSNTYKQKRALHLFPTKNFLTLCSGSAKSR